MRLPPPPGPLLFLGRPPVNDDDWAGYELMSVAKENLLLPPSSIDNPAIPWVYVDAATLIRYPLNVMAWLDRFTAGGALAMTVIGPDWVGDDAEYHLLFRAICALLSRAGWVGLRGLEEPPSKTEKVFFRKRERTARYRLTQPGLGDREDCLALFERAFQETPNAELWAWKYGENRGVSVIARRGEALVAHYGCVSRPVLFFGKPAQAVQICDVMVDPSERGLMTKTGAFFNAAAASQEKIIGCDRYVCGFGFPNHRHMVLGRRAGLYDEVDRLVELRWSPRKALPSMNTTARPIADVSDAAKTIELLWSRMSTDLATHIVGVRDTAYLRHRYEAHPRFEYHLFLVRRRVGNIPLGIIVLRREGELARLIDVVGSLRHLHVLVDYARRVAAEWGVTALVGWITSSQARYLNAGNAEEVSTDIRIPGNCYVERVPVDRLRNRWWLMMGDTDFM